MAASRVSEVPLRWLPGVLLAVGSVAAALEARRLGLGNASKPGAGFFPFWLSVALALVAVLIAAGIGRGEPQQPPQSESSRPSLALQAFLALVLYCALLIPLGYIPATALFFCLEARLIERLTWPRACMLADRKSTRLNSSH